jgi:PAS domain-containing protein
MASPGRVYASLEGSRGRGCPLECTSTKNKPTGSISLQPAIGVQEEVVLNVRDVTERVRVEERLKESEQRFRAQYKGIPVPTYSWRKVDEDFVLVDHNDAAHHFSHGRIADLLGSRATEVFSNEPQILELLSRCFEEKTIIRQEMPYSALHNTWRYLAKKCYHGLKIRTV